MVNFEEIDKARKLLDLSKILLEYIEEYRFSFKKEEVERNDPERNMRRFYKDWLRQ